MARAVVIEEDPPTRELLVLPRGDAGHGVLAAGDGEHGVSAMPASWTDFVVLDYLLSTMAG